MTGTKNSSSLLKTLGFPGCVSSGSTTAAHRSRRCARRARNMDVQEENVWLDPAHQPGDFLAVARLPRNSKARLGLE
jgi:hypothetical protein